VQLPRGLLAAVAVVGGLAAGCGAGSGRAAGPASPSSPPAPSTLPTTAPTTVAAAPTTTVYKPAGGQPSPDDAAGRLMAAWGDGNRTEAALVAAPAAIAALFSVPYPAGYLQARGCTDPTTNPGTCTYRNTRTDAIYEVTVVDGPTGWYVSAVTPET
jgi:hypothetical protein